MHGNRDVITYVSASELSTIQLYDDSTGLPTAWNWFVSATSGTTLIASQENPIVNFNDYSDKWITVSAGYYYLPVLLSASKDSGAITATKHRNIYFQQPYYSSGHGEQPVAYFDFTIVQFDNNIFDVTYTDGSTGATSWGFDFGDETSISYFPTSAHRYYTSATATINPILDVNNGASSYTTQIDFPYANYTYTKSYGDDYTDVTFVDHSIGANSYSFDYGDGTSASEFPTSAYRYYTSAYTSATPILSITSDFGVSTYSETINLSAASIELKGWWKAENNLVDSINGNDAYVEGDISYTSGVSGYYFDSDYTDVLITPTSATQLKPDNTWQLEFNFIMKAAVNYNYFPFNRVNTFAFRYTNSPEQFELYSFYADGGGAYTKMDFPCTLATETEYGIKIKSTAGTWQLWVNGVEITPSTAVDAPVWGESVQPERFGCLYKYNFGNIKISTNN